MDKHKQTAKKRMGGGKNWPDRISRMLLIKLKKWNIHRTAKLRERISSIYIDGIVI